VNNIFTNNQTLANNKFLQGIYSSTAYNLIGLDASSQLLLGSSGLTPIILGSNVSLGTDFFSTKTLTIQGVYGNRQFWKSNGVTAFLSLAADGADLGVQEAKSLFFSTNTVRRIEVTALGGVRLIGTSGDLTVEGTGTSSFAGKLQFSQVFGDKVYLYPAGNSSFGFGIQANEFRFFSGGMTDRLTFGYGASTTFLSKLRMDWLNSVFGPEADNVFDLGSASQRWKNAFFYSANFFQFRMPGSVAPALSPAGSVGFYFDSTSNQFKLSENGGAFVALTTSILSGSTSGSPTASQHVLIYPVAAKIVLNAGFAEAQGYCVTTPTSSATFAITRRAAGTTTDNQIGTMIFNAGSHTAIFSVTDSSQLTLNIGDLLLVTSPVSPDATLSDVGATLIGRSQ